MSAVSKYACLDAPIALASCDEEASKLEIVAETGIYLKNTLLKTIVITFARNADIKLDTVIHFQKFIVLKIK